MEHRKTWGYRDVTLSLLFVCRKIFYKKKPLLQGAALKLVLKAVMARLSPTEV